MLHTKDSAKVQSWTQQIIRQVRYRAAESGTPFNITSQDLLELWTGYCPALGMKLKLESKSTPSSPSLDRLIPSLGYTKGNVQIISVRANSIKQDANPRELRMVANWLESAYMKESGT